MLYLHDLNKNMKLPSFFHPSHSIAARLTWRVVGTLFLISMILSALVLAAIWIVGILIFGALYWSRMDVSEEKINTVFSAVEVALSNNVPELEESINNKDKEPPTPLTQTMSQGKDSWLPHMCTATAQV